MVDDMHREIEHYLSVHTFDSDTRYGIVNEGKNLLKYFENHSEEELLEDIEIYKISASNGNVSIWKTETRAFLNVGKFSFYYHGDCYESTIFDRNGNPTGGSYWITDNKLNEPSLHFYDGKASGELYILAPVSEERKKNIIESAKRETLYKCRERFGRW